MHAIIISIGDELVLGQTIDTNSAWLSQQLASVGCAVRSHITVGDDQRAIEDAMNESVGRCDFLVCTGGIGPTADDLTRQALAAVMNEPLELNDAWLQTVKHFFAARGRTMPESNSIQAMIPRGARILHNPNGTAAGIDADYISGDQKTVCRVFVMPGVPVEMKAMFARDVLPAVEKQSGGAVILSRTLHTFGAGESAVAEMLGEQMMRSRNPSVGTTVSQGIVSLRINARFESKQRAAEELERTIQACRTRLADLIYGEEDETLQEVVGQRLASSRKTVTTAESCTGGLLAKMLTDVPGSSDYFKTGFITYSNQAKYERLGVSTEVINVYGAVSEPVVVAMARNARRLAKADYALAISGVAGPSGGSESKPVGTVCIALAFPPLPPEEGRGEGAGQVDESPALARTFLFPGDRAWVRDRSAKMALTMLRFHLLGKPLPF
jgi:nicotinamide-nucleotide amidase